MNEISPERTCHGEERETLREKPNLWNMTVTVIPIVVGALGTVLKCLGKKKTGGIRY